MNEKFYIAYSSSNAMYSHDQLLVKVNDTSTEYQVNINLLGSFSLGAYIRLKEIILLVPVPKNIICNMVMKSSSLLSSRIFSQA